MTALFLLPGIGGRASLWRPTAEAFAPMHRVQAWEVPGYDGTGATPDSIAAMADRAAASLGTPDAVWVGHSLGGMIAIEAALRHPARVRGLVLVATSPAFGSRDPAFRDAFLAARLAPLEAGRGMAAVARTLVPSMLGREAEPAAAGLAEAAMASVPEAAYRAALHALTGFDRRADLARIDVPALVLAGEDDAVAPPRGMARLAAAMPRARFVVLPGLGHLLPVESPERFHAALDPFLHEIEAEERI